MNEKGNLYGVGVGPGDAELMTLKAVRLIQECDAIAIPQKDRARCVALRIAAEAVPEALKKPILPLDMPMVRDREARERALSAAADRLKEVLDEGKNVVFLTLGDPSIYSTYGYLQCRIQQAGYETETVPGVPSFCAAAAALGEPLCLDTEALHILPGGVESEANAVTRVYMKGGVSQLKHTLKTHAGPVFAAENVGMADQRLYRTWEQIPEDTGYFTLIIAKETKL